MVVLAEGHLTFSGPTRQGGFTQTWAEGHVERMGLVFQYRERSLEAPHFLAYCSLAVPEQSQSRM